MTLGERIKKIRKDNDLTQQLFAEKIGTTANVLTNYETGRRNPSSSVINNICKTFNVREEWLRTGEGKMPAKLSEEDEISAMVGRLITGESADFKRRLVNALSTLKDEQWLLLEAKLKEIVGVRGTASQVVDAKIETTTPEQPNLGLAEKIAELERQIHEKDKQLQEFSARLAAMEEEDALGLLPDTGNLA